MNILNIYTNYWVSCLCFIIIILPTNAQYSTEQIRLQAQSDINYINSLLDITDQNTQASINQLLLIDRQIVSRSTVIQSIEQEIKLLNIDIQAKLLSIAQLQSYIDAMLKEYEEMIYYAYKNRSSYQLIMFILSSDDFNQAYKRLKYLQQYTTYRKEQMQLILDKKTELQAELKTLEAEKIHKQLLAQNKQKELLALANQRYARQQLLTQLKGQKSTLIDDFYTQTRAASTLDQQVSQIIDYNISTVTSTKDHATKLFESYRGKLIWPLTRGVVIAEFGERPHPYLDGIMITNNGIDISTNSDTEIKSVFDGYVTKIVDSGASKAVLISHGNYFTLYANLSQVFVKQGDDVATQQLIGKVYTDPADGAVLNFQVWNSDKKLNPLNWLKER